MKTQYQKAVEFQQLHRRDGAFVIPNPWDVGSARLLAQLGFPALATTSAGYAFSRGLPDNAVGRAQMMLHLADMAGAVDLPLSADLENGFGAAPECVAESIRMAAAAGVVGASIEDATGDPAAPLYPLAQAVERIEAAVAAARALDFPFTLTARAENYLVGRPDLDDTIARLQAYQAAGADVLFAPGLSRREDIATVVQEVERPLNVIMGMVGVPLTVADLAALGVRRISVGGSLARTALGALMRAATEIRDQGSFGYAAEAISFRDINAMFQTEG